MHVDYTAPLLQSMAHALITIVIASLIAEKLIMESVWIFSSDFENDLRISGLI